jgi:hypothetical protein
MRIQATKNNRKRGGQPKHWCERAKVLVWYREVKSRCNLTDHELDKLFAWVENTGNIQTSDDRPRTFEFIGKYAREPRGIPGKWRCMDSLVSFVDEDPRFVGAKYLYESYFWKLLTTETHDIKDLLDEFNKLIHESQLRIIDPTKSNEFYSTIQECGREVIFDRCLRLSIQRMNILSGITLVWILKLIARSPRTNYVRSVCELLIDNQINDFFELYFAADSHFDYYQRAIETFVHGRIEAKSAQFGGYGFAEDMSEWLILPRYIYESISAEIFFQSGFSTSRIYST